MKKIPRLLTILVCFVSMACASLAQADFVDRGGGMIYDDVLDITWLKDANYADGLMTWDAAKAWAESLTVGTYDDWRLPTFDPDNPRPVVPTLSNEIGSLWSQLNGGQNIGSSTDISPFMNLPYQSGDSEWYWTGLEGSYDDPPDTSQAWRFSINCACWDSQGKDAEFYAWAVRSGDVAEQVAIDIKPGKTPNSINPTSGQKIPVAILTTDTFDATQVDWETITFGPDGATEFHWRAHVKDVDDDGDADLLLHFNTQDTGIACGDDEAGLTGATFDGHRITGTDSVTPLPCPAAEVGHIWRVNYSQTSVNSMNGKVETHVLGSDSSFASSDADYWNEVHPVPATQTLLETSVAGGGAPSITFVGQATTSTATGTPMSGEPIDDDLDNWAARFSTNVVDWELQGLDPNVFYDLVFYDLDSLTASILLTTQVDSNGNGVLDQADTIRWDNGRDFSLFQDVQPSATGVIRGRWTGSSSTFVDVAGFQVAERTN